MIEGNTKLERWKNALKNPKLIKEAMMNITPLQQVHATATMHMGGMIGLIFAMITMIWRNTWYFTLFLVFMIGLQWLQYVKTMQSYKQLSSMMSQMEALANIKQEETKDEQKWTDRF